MKKKSNKPASPAMRFFFGRIFPLFFLAAGAIMLFIGGRTMIQAHQSSSWPSTQGVIKSSSVESSRGTKRGGKKRRRKRRKRTYRAEVLYDFKVAEKSFCGDTVAFGDYGSSDSSHARQIVKQYPKGKAVTVYYSQKNPEQCILEPGIKSQALFLPGIGLLFFGVGGFMAIVLPKKIKQAEEAKLLEKTEDQTEPDTDEDFLTEPVNS